MTTTDPTMDDVEAERLIALGMLLDRAALLEYDLARAFTMLLENKHATFLAAGQSAEWLMQNCEVFARVRQGIPEALEKALTNQGSTSAPPASLCYR